MCVGLAVWGGHWESVDGQAVDACKDFRAEHEGFIDDIFGNNDDADAFVHDGDWLAAFGDFDYEWCRVYGDFADGAAWSEEDEGVFGGTQGTEGGVVEGVLW